MQDSQGTGAGRAGDGPRSPFGSRSKSSGASQLTKLQRLIFVCVCGLVYFVLFFSLKRIAAKIRQNCKIPKWPLVRYL